MNLIVFYVPIILRTILICNAMIFAGVGLTRLLGGFGLFINFCIRLNCVLRYVFIFYFCMDFESEMDNGNNTTVLCLDKSCTKQ